MVQGKGLEISGYRGKLAPGDSWGLGKQEGQRKIFGGWMEGQSVLSLSSKQGETGAVVTEVRYHVNYDFPFPLLTYNTAEGISFWNHTSPKGGGMRGKFEGREGLTFLHPTEGHMLYPHPLNRH